MVVVPYPSFDEPITRIFGVGRVIIRLPGGANRCEVFAAKKVSDWFLVLGGGASIVALCHGSEHRVVPS